MILWTKLNTKKNKEKLIVTGSDHSFVEEDKKLKKINQEGKLVEVKTVGFDEFMTNLGFITQKKER